MQFKMVTIVSNPRLSADTVSISAKLASDHDTEELPQIVLKVGQLRKSLKPRINQKVKNKNVISLNPSTMRRLFLSSGRRYGFYIGEGEIKLGPVVGILAESSGDAYKPFYGQTYFFKQMITYGRRLGQICFAFSINGIHWHNNTISGWTYAGGRWVRSTFPMPNVVYPRHKGYSRAYIRARRGMQSHGVLISNPPLIGKWLTYKILSENPELAEHIPDTDLIDSLKKVDAMVNKYQGVYIKPVNGSLGRNIIKVVKSPRGKRYIYQYRRNEGVYRGSARSMAALRRKLYSIMGRRPYIVQKQINLIRSRGSILDVRVLIQKDHSGESSITGMACRVGRSGAITSNISSGGYALRVNQVLQARFHSEEKVNEIIETIRTVALEAARTLENSIGPVGEMGVDIGVDRDGHIWFIEANLKPGRQVFSLLRQTRTRMMTIYKPLLYARYLAGFQEKTVEP